MGVPEPPGGMATAMVPKKSGKMSKGCYRIDVGSTTTLDLYSMSKIYLHLNCSLSKTFVQLEWDNVGQQILRPKQSRHGIEASTIDDRHHRQALQRSSRWMKSGGKNGRRCAQAFVSIKKEPKYAGWGLELAQCERARVAGPESNSTSFDHCF